MATPRLVGTVGPGFTISLKHNGELAKTLKAGTYTFVISDRRASTTSSSKVPASNGMITTVPFTGTKTVTIKLRKGKYKYYCRPHESSMFGFVKVT